MDEMNRTTKKNPPLETSISFMYSNLDEYEASQMNSYFTKLTPSPTDQGNIFIGFPTHQTTGLSGLLAGHFIPTVERESLDFVDPSLASWNQELLNCCGILARVCFESELDSIQELYSVMTLDDVSSIWLRRKANHALASFTLHVSTPSPLVGQLISNGFAKHCSRQFRILSTLGIHEAHKVRLPDALVQSFSKSIPFVCPESLTDCKVLFDRLISSQTLSKVGVEDVLSEVSSRPLTMSESSSLMKWWIIETRAGRVTGPHLDKLRLSWRLQQGDSILEMRKMTHFSHTKMVNALDLPSFVLPLELTRTFSDSDLKDCFWRWESLKLITWSMFITKHEHFGVVPQFTEKVMQLLARQYSHLSQTDQAILISLVSPLPCIVTQKGMQLPSLSYFKSVTLFPDLPKVCFEKPISDGFLKSLGVREHVDLQLVFNRLNDLNWDQTKLIKYLASIQSKLNEVERIKITNSPIFLSNDDSGERFLASQLLAPLDFFVDLKVPVLQYSGKWRQNDESRFMVSLGLNESLPLDLLLNILSKTSEDGQRIRLIKYFVDSFDTYKSVYRPTSVNVDFLPTMDGRLMKPRECFVDQKCASMGYPVLIPSLSIWSEKLGVAEAPTSSVLLTELQSKPPTLESASLVFAFLYSRQHSFSTGDWNRIKTMAFIPVKRGESVGYFSPGNVYFKSTDDSFQYGDHFTYIDVGEPANSFLRACGVKDQPSPLELATNLVDDPQSFLKSLGYARYLGLLREIAAHYPIIARNSRLLSRMKSSCFLIGIQGDSKDETQYVLEKASKIYLLDDTVLSQLFKPLGAPMDHILEAMYQDLGSKWLSRQVKESKEPVGKPFSSDLSKELEVLIRARASILLYDGQQMRASDELISGAAAFLSDIQVLEIQDIQVVRVFENQTRKSKITATCIEHQRKRILLITTNFDSYDVASVLGKLILTKPRLNDFLLLSILLSSSLENLSLKGFPVNRIMELEKSKLREPLREPRPMERVERTERPGKEQPLDKLKSLFPDADASFLENRLGLAGPDVDLHEISNDLLTNGYPKKDTSSPSKQVEQVMELFPDADESQIKSALTRSNVEQVVNDMSEKGYSKKKPQESHPIPEGFLSSFGSGLLKNATSWIKAASSMIPTQTQESIRPDGTKQLKSALQKAVQASRGSGTSSIQSQIPLTDRPSVQPNECHIMAEQDLKLITTVQNVSVYADVAVMDEALAAFQKDSGIILQRFVSCLLVLSNVFHLDPSSIHVYWDRDGSTVAFNRSKSLFFNYRIFLGLHSPSSTSINDFVQMPGNFKSSTESLQTVVEAQETYYYWFMTFCHELAHHFVSEHNSNHEYYMSSFAECYMASLYQSLSSLKVV